MSTKNRINVNFSVDLPEGVTARRIARWLLPTPGNVLFTTLVIGVVIWAQMAGAAPWMRPMAQSSGASATTINYQGKLADSAGTPLSGNYDLKFALYDALEGGSMIWPGDGQPEPHEDVPVSEGLFSVGLGSRTPEGIPASVWNDDRWLQIWVESEKLAPRELIRSVPLAGMALTVPDGSIGSTALNLDSGTVCLSETVELDSPGDYAIVEVPELRLDFSLNSPSKVLIWIDGLARFAQPSDLDGEIGILLSLDGNPETATYGHYHNIWFNLKGERILNLDSGEHSLQATIQSYRQSTITLHGNHDHWRTCVNYLVLGEQ